MGSSGALFDFSALSFVLITALALLGFIRGVRAEGITLAGVLASGVIFANETLRSRIASLVNKIPKVVDMLLAPEGAPSALSTKVPDPTAGTLIKTPDERLLFYLALFLIGVLLFYLAGWLFGGVAFGRTERLIGAVMGGLSGFVVNLTLLNFSQEYFSRHGNIEGLRVELPNLFSPTLPTTNYLMQYTPLVFIASLFLMAFLVVASLVRR